MQNEIIRPSPLLDEDGRLIQRGWARRPLLDYNKENIKVGWHRIKEWDFYAVHDDNFALGYFLADLGYFTLAAISVYNFKEGESYATGGLRLFTRGKIGLSDSSLEGNTTFKNWMFGEISLERHPKEHIFHIEASKFKGLQAEIHLEIDPSQDAMVVATGYDDSKPNCFYYNHKVNMMPATGTMEFKGKQIDFSPENAIGNFDWGRGVWPYKSHWLWGTGGGVVDGHEIWFNIGAGFGDLSTHTENMIFVDGKCHKTDQVEFHPAKKRSGKPWRINSNDERIELQLVPKIDSSNYMNIGFMKTDNNQIHGSYSGKLVLDDGTVLEIADIHGHAEDIHYLW